MYAGKSCNCNPNSTFPPWYSFCVWFGCSGSLRRMGLWSNCVVRVRMRDAIMNDWYLLNCQVLDYHFLGQKLHLHEYCCTPCRLWATIGASCRSGCCICIWIFSAAFVLSKFTLEPRHLQIGWCFESALITGLKPSARLLGWDTRQETLYNELYLLTLQVSDIRRVAFQVLQFYARKCPKKRQKC